MTGEFGEIWLSVFQIRTLLLHLPRTQSNLTLLNIPLAHELSN